MASGSDSVVDECGPEQAWSALEADENAQLVDVRTRPEWSFVGVPDLTALGRRVILVEWRQYPAMATNAAFPEQVLESLGGTAPSQLFFICRSGARSMEAAHVMAAHFDSRGETVRCVNVAEGFEGDLDPARHRGSRNGWKFRGLAWQQS